MPAQAGVMSAVQLRADRCPGCGSSDTYDPLRGVIVHAADGPGITCRYCGWSGYRKDLLTAADFAAQDPMQRDRRCYPAECSAPPTDDEIADFGDLAFNRRLDLADDLEQPLQ